MNFDNLVVRVDKPYPEIVDATDCNKTVGILRNLATSRYSELSAVLQYLFYSVVTDMTNSDIAGIFEEIAVVEMAHLHLLMHAITDFGGLPKYEDANRQPFNVSGVRYTEKLKDMLDISIEGEENAYNDYVNASKQVSNKSLSLLLLRIAEDEKKHAEVLRTVRNNVTFFSI